MSETKTNSETNSRTSLAPYPCNLCGETISRFYAHNCLRASCVEEAPSTPKPKAVEDFETIKARLEELRKEREEIENKKEPETKAGLDTSSLKIGDIVHVAGLGSIDCVIAEIVTPDVIIILWNNNGSLGRSSIRTSHITHIIQKL